MIRLSVIHHGVRSFTYACTHGRITKIIRLRITIIIIRSSRRTISTINIDISNLTKSATTKHRRVNVGAAVKRVLQDGMHVRETVNGSFTGPHRRPYRGRGQETQRVDFFSVFVIPFFLSMNEIYLHSNPRSL